MKKNEWKEHRINAINRRIKRSGNARYLTEYYLDEYIAICSSKGRSKKEFKLEKGGKNESLH